MKKSMISSIFAAGLILSISACQKELGYTGFADPDSSEGAAISLSTDKAVYGAGETVSFTADRIPSGETYVRYKHLGRQIGSEELLTRNKWTWTAPSGDYKGYMAEVYQKGTDGDKILAAIAIDVSSDWDRFPRYGFLSTFFRMDAVNCDDVIAALNRLHINGVQFQDWHWKHHWPLAQDKATLQPLETYVDIASRSTSMQTVRNYIASCHKYGMKAIFYNLCFGALDDAAEDGVREDWYMYKDAGHQTIDMHVLGSPFKSSVYLVNPANSEWLSYIGEKTDDVYDNLGFDGYQIDQLGGRGTLYDYEGNVIDLTAGYADFIDEMKRRQPGKDLIMNAVSGYGADRILATGNTVFAYNEMWDGEAQYTDLKRVIEENERYGGSGMKTVFAAYMNYDKSGSQGTFNTPGILLTDAVMFALGGSHLEMGEHMLCHEYFPNNNLGMTEELKSSLIAYYDFMTAYQNLLRDGGSFIDMTVTSADGAYPIKAWEPATGNIVTLAKEVGDRQAIHFLNFLNADSTSWRDIDGTMPAPETLSDFAVTVTIPDGRQVNSVWFASPDAGFGASESLAFSQDGQTLSVTIPSLEYWSMLVLEYTQDGSGL